MREYVEKILRSPLAAPAFLFVVAFGLRLGLVISAADYPLFTAPIMDMLYHHEWAERIVAGDFWGDEPFFRAPLYPYFLALLYWISGSSIFFARAVQAALGGVSAVVCYYTGLEIFRSKRIAFVGGTLLATIWTAVYFDVELLLVVLEILFDLLAVLFLSRAREGKTGDFILAGLFTGLSAITRPNILAFALFAWLIYLLANRRPKGRRLAVGLVAFYALTFAVILPVTIRNYAVGGDLVPISSQGGVNLYIGNNPDADGVTAVVPGTRADWWGGYYDTKLLAETVEGRELKPSEVNNFYIRKTLEFVRDEPIAAVKLMLWKAYLFTNAVELANNFDNNYLKQEFALLKYNPVSLYVILPFAFFGAGVLAARFRGYAPAYLFTLTYSGTVVLFFVNDKFRMPVVPFFCLFAAVGFFWLWEKSRRREIKAFGVGLAVLAVLFVYTTVRPPGAPEDPYFIQARTTIGSIYETAGRFEDAQRELTKAIDDDPENVTALVALANVYYKTGLEEKAVELYKKALRLKPNEMSALNNLGIYHTEKGEYEKAYEYFGRSIEAHPWNSRTYYFLAKTLVADGRPDEAREQLRLAIKYQDNFKAAYVLLGELALAGGDLGEAEYAYRSLLKEDPSSSTGFRGLAETLYRKGDPSGAETYYRKLTVADAQDGDAHYNLACCLALQGKEEAALEELRKALEIDAERYRGFARDDPDFEALRDNDEFTRLTEK